MEDPYLKELIEKQTKKEPLYTEIKGNYFFAKARDVLGNWHYLSADSEEAIEKYCREYSPSVLSDNELAIDQWINYVDPIMVCFAFKWVGERHNPFVVAKPFKYGGDKKWTWENSRYRSEKVRLSFFITGNLIFAGSIASVEVITKLALYYWHERLWNDRMVSHRR